MADNIPFPLSGTMILDSDGTPSDGALLEVFDAGTGTQKDVWTDNGLTAAAANPLVCTSGVVPLRFLGTGDYKVTFKDSDGVTLSHYPTWDNVTSALDTSSYLTTTVAPSRAIITKSGVYTTVAADHGKQINCNASGGDFTVTLDSAVDYADGGDQLFKNTENTGVVTATAPGAETIDGLASIEIGPKSSAVVRSDGSAFYVSEKYDATKDLVTTTYAASVALALTYPTGTNYQITLTGDLTLANPTSVRPGSFFTVTLIQDATGGRDVTFGSNFQKEPFVDVAASAVTVLGCHCRSATVIDTWVISGGADSWDYVAYNQQTQNTAGGGATSGSYEDVPLNTVDYDRFGVGSPSSDQVTFPPGVWEFEWRVIFFNTGISTTQLYDNTAAAVVEFGTNCQPGSDTDNSVGWARVTLSAASAISVQSRVTSTKATNGFGTPANFNVERYGFLKARKVASL